MIGSLLFLTLLFFVNFTARVIPAPLLPTIEGDLQLDHGQAGALFLFIALGYFTALMGSGYISSRLRHKNTILLSSFATGLAFLATSFSHSVWELRLGFLCLGMATGLYFPSAMATITSLFSSQHWGKAIGIHELAPNLAFAVAPLLADLLLGFFSWRGALGVIGMVSIVLGGIFAAFGRGGEFAGQAPDLPYLVGLFRNRTFWILLALFSLGISSSIGIYSMLPLFLVNDQSMDQNWANTVLAFSRAPAVLAAFLGGWLSDRFGAQRTMTLVLFIIGLVMMSLGFASGILTVVLIFLQAVLAGCFFPAALAALSLFGVGQSRNLIVGFTIPFAYVVGAGATPTLIGVLGQAGSFGWGISLVGILMWVGMLLCFRLQLPERRSLEL